MGNLLDDSKTNINSLSVDENSKSRARCGPIQLNRSDSVYRHRLSECNKKKDIRSQYFNLLSARNKEENENRLSLKPQSYFKNDLEELAGSFDRNYIDNKDFDLKIDKEKNLQNKKKNSGLKTKKIESIVNSVIKSNNKNKVNTNKVNKSQDSDDISSFSVTKDILILNNETESDSLNLNKPVDYIELNKSLKMKLKEDKTVISEKELENNKQLPKSEHKAKNEYVLNYVKRGEDLRRSYIAKLISKQIWTNPKKEKDHNTVIIFDWDDTLLCTSFLTPNGFFNEDLELSERDKEKIAKLEFSTLRILTAALQKGDTFIITNAAPGWVEYSSERFYPSVRKLLPQLKIISARGDWERFYPHDARMWKIQAFLNMQKNFDSELVTNIICLGDSFIEMEAAHVLASKFSQAFIKTIKFREGPKPEELNKQLSLVADQFPVIYSSVKNLTIRVEKKIR